LSENKYQIEIDEFRENFAEFREKRIVIYGIGRYTATLVEFIDDYQFVGLMDKDPSKQGEYIFGIPIVSLDEAERIADLIIINTSETYWNVIFSRIEGAKIPIYYKNGVKAEKSSEIDAAYKYAELSLEELRRKAFGADIVSFDFFDTLFCRLVSNPRDVFNMVLISNDIRIKAKGLLDEYYTLDELYEEIEKISEYSKEELINLKKREIELEHRLLVPRTVILDLFKELIISGKDVYIISDMYISKQFYIDELKKYNITINVDNILVSSELKMSKSDGSIWSYYKENFVKNKMAIHIGDDKVSDVEMPVKCGIQSFLVPNNWSLIEESNIRKILSKCQNDYDSRLLALISAKYYGNPFRQVKSKGRMHIENEKEMGYLVFGPLILTFIIWLEEQRKKDGISKLLFLSRDGYLLKDDYELYCSLTRTSCDYEYIIISRQLAILANCKEKEDVHYYMSIPYSGSISELFEDRLGIEITEQPGKTVRDYIDNKWTQISEKLSEIADNYNKYLNTRKIDDKCAVVDQGFYGNNQRYLSKLVNENLPGYYFCANLSEKNPNTKIQDMKACFQNKNDKTASKSNVLKYMIFLESFMTAPSGMARFINSKGFIYGEPKNNQILFHKKEIINEGVKEFITDYCKVFYDCKSEMSIGFVDEWYGMCFGGTVTYSEEIKKSFYNDNGMMNRIESSLFY